MFNRLLLLPLLVLVVSCDYSETEEILSGSDSFVVTSIEVESFSGGAKEEIPNDVPIYLPGDSTALGRELKGPYYKNNITLDNPKPYIDEEEKATYFAHEYLSKIEVDYGPFFQEATDSRVSLFALELIKVIEKLQNSETVFNYCIKGVEVHNLVEYYGWSVVMRDCSRHDEWRVIANTLYQAIGSATNKWTPRLYEPYSSSPLKLN